MRAVVALLSALSFGGAVRGAADVSVETLDGTVIRGAWAGVAGDGQVLLDVAGAQRGFAADTLRQVRFDQPGAPQPPGKPPFVLELADGGRIPIAALKSGAAGAVVVDTPLATALPIGFKHLAAIRVGRLAENPEAARLFEAEFAQRQPGKDVLIASVGGAVRSVRGTLTALDAQSGRFDFGGADRPFKVDDVFAVIFATGAIAPPRAPAELRLTDAAVLRGSLAASDAAGVNIQPAFGGTLTVPVDRLRTIELASERVVLLSDLTPSQTNVEGLLHARWPVRKDRSVSNTALVLGGREFARGLGVHSKCELVYDLDAAYERFVAVIGIDDAARPLGSVVFKLLGDGRLLFDSGPTTGADEPRSVNLPIAGVKKLTLLVDYGDGLDLADQADWADARLIRPPAAAQPTSRPAPRRTG